MSRPTKPKGYYVTAIIDGGTGNQRTSFLCGPFGTHRAAHMMVPAISYLARKHADPRLQFAAYGVTKVTMTGETPRTLPRGRFADLAGLIDDAYVGRVIDPWGMTRRR